MKGETAAITVDMIQKVAEILTVDPVGLITMHPGNFIQNGNNSPNAANGYFNYQGADKEIMSTLIKTMEGLVELNGRLMELMDRFDRK